MKKTLKIVIILVSIPVVLFAIAAGVLASIDLNDYRAEIEQAVADSTGRQLSVKGDLTKSFFPWLGAKVESVSLNNAEGFQPETFAAIEKLEIKIDTLSLLYLKPYISRIVIKGLDLHLARDDNGKSNWEDLSQPKTSPDKTIQQTDKQPELPSGKSDEVLASLKIAGLTIENANVSWVDKQAGANYALKSFNLNISEIALNQPLSLESDFTVISESPALNARIKISSQQINWDLNQQRYGVMPLTINVDANGEALPVSPSSAKLLLTASVDLKQQTLSLSDLQLNALGVSVNAKAEMSQLLDAPNYQASIKLASLNPRDIMKVLAIPAPDMADNSALTALSAEMEISGQLDQVKVTPLLIKLDQTNIKTEASVKDFSKPAISAKVAIDQIDLDRYLPPVPDAPANQEQGDAAQEANTTKPGPLPIPVELIRGLNVLAQLDAKKVTVRKLDVDELHAKVRVNDGVAKVNPLSLNVADGSITSDIALDVTRDTPRYQLTQAINQVKAAPLAKAFAGEDYVSGKLILNASMTSGGLFVDEIKKNLNGKFSFSFSDGAVKGFNLGERIRKAKAKFDKKDYEPSGEPMQTDFAELTGTATIKNGVLSNNDLNAKSPLLRVDGKGKVNLVEENLNYLVTTNLVGTSKGQGGKSVEELKGIPIPIQLTGPFNNIKWDYKWSVVTKALRDKLKKKTATKIKAKKEAVKKELDEKKDKKVEEIKEKAKDKLKKLFKF